MKVIIADDHQIVREGISALLASEHDVELIGDVASGHQLLELIEGAGADVVLLDVRMPEMTGLDVLAKMRRRGVSVPVVILSMHDDPAYVKRAIELGASGYLLKTVGKRELLRALRLVAGGGSYIQGEITAPLIAHMVNPDAELVGELTEMEIAMLDMLASGLDNRAMAQRLGESEVRLKSQLRTLYRRLNVKRRSEAVAVALRLGIIT